MALAVLLILFALATWLAVADQRTAFFVSVFLIPWGGLVVDVGLRITAYQLTIAPLCLVCLARATQPGWAPPRIVGGGLLLALALYGVVWSLLQIGFIPIVSVTGGALRGPSTRAIIQIILFLFNLSPAILAAILLRSEADIHKTLRLYLASLVVLAILGWVQLASWYGIGYNPIPVDVVSVALGGPTEYLREGQFAFDLLNIYRMNSLAGEPRNLATALVLGMLAIQAIALATAQIPARQLALIWSFLFVSTLATFSTSGAGVWLVGTAALLPSMWVLGIKVQRSTRAIGIGLAALLLPLALGIAVAEARGIPIIDLAAERTFERIDTSGAVEDFDLAITDFLGAHPAAAVTGVGLGNAHLYAMPYLDPLFALYAEGRVFTGKSSIVRIVSELGIIGFALFLAWYLRLLLLTRTVVRDDPQMVAVVPIAIVVLLAYLATSQVQAEIWTLGGCLAVLVRLRAPLPRWRATLASA